MNDLGYCAHVRKSGDRQHGTFVGAVVGIAVGDSVKRAGELVGAVVVGNAVVGNAVVGNAVDGVAVVHCTHPVQ